MEINNGIQLLIVITNTNTYLVELDQSDEFEYEIMSHIRIKTENSHTILLMFAVIELNGLISSKEIKYINWIQISDINLILVFKSIFIVTNITTSMRWIINKSEYNFAIRLVVNPLTSSLSTFDSSKFWWLLLSIAYRTVQLNINVNTNKINQASHHDHLWPAIRIIVKLVEACCVD